MPYIKYSSVDGHRRCLGRYPAAQRFLFHSSPRSHSQRCQPAGPVWSEQTAAIEQVHPLYTPVLLPRALQPGLFSNPQFLLLATCTEQGISLSHFAFRAHFNTNSTCVANKSHVSQGGAASGSWGLGPTAVIPLECLSLLWKKPGNVDEKVDQTGNFTPEAAFPAFQKRIPSNSAAVLWIHDHKEKS